jgi:hypothetical protein
MVGPYVRLPRFFPMIKDCLTETMLIPLMHHAADVPLDTNVKKNDNMIPRKAPMSYMVPL